MKSTGEVMGIDAAFGVAFAKAQLGAGTHAAAVAARSFVSVQDADKAGAVADRAAAGALRLHVWSTRGHGGDYLRERGVPIEAINKVQDGSPHAVDAIRAGQIQLVINTPKGSGAHQDSFPLRRTALECRVPYFTTIAGAAAAAARASSICSSGASRVRSLQEYHARRAD